MAAVAEGGAVVVSEETRRRLGEEFGVEDLGYKSLKNVAEPCRVYRLTAEVEPASDRVSEPR